MDPREMDPYQILQGLPPQPPILVSPAQPQPLQQATMSSQGTIVHPGQQEEHDELEGRDESMHQLNSADVFSSYENRSLLPGSKPHPGDIVEAAPLARVSDNSPARIKRKKERDKVQETPQKEESEEEEKVFKGEPQDDEGYGIYGENDYASAQASQDIYPGEKHPLSGSPKKKRRPNVRPFLFTPEQEEELATWYRDNPCFYNKKCTKFRMRQLKERLLENKAKEFKDLEGQQCNASQLLTWWTNMRTSYGRVSKEPESGSGSGNHVPSERELWVKQAFSFLSGHIVRVRRVPKSKKSQRREDVYDYDEDSLDPETASNRDNNNNHYNHTTSSSSSALHDIDLINAHFEAVPGTSTVLGGGRLSSGVRGSEELDVAKIEQVCMNLLQPLQAPPPPRLASPVPRPASPATEELENFAKNIVCSMRRVPEEHWNDAKVEMMMVVRNYSRKPSRQYHSYGDGK